MLPSSTGDNGRAEGQCITSLQFISLLHFSLDIIPSRSFNTLCAHVCAVSVIRSVATPSFFYPRHNLYFQDRRPLAPAAVAKMVVRKEDNSVVDVEYVFFAFLHRPCLIPFLLLRDIDCSFFLVTVDLWSADGKREMNLVLHPSSSAERYVATNAQKSRKPRSTDPPSSPNIEQHSPASSHSTPNSVHQQPRLPVACHLI